MSDPSGAREPSGDRRAHAGPSGRWLSIIAVAVTIASLFGPIAASGIWDPPELEVIELSRRIAHTLLGGSALTIEGGNNIVPTQRELGKGQLPFTSIAAGLRVLGMSEWAGRVPLALWGVLGVLATALLVRRFADRRAAALSAIVLSTTPLYFLHARTMLGDITTMATLAIGVAGLAIAVFDRELRGWMRSAALLVGLAALVLGVLCRGVLVGTAVPALAVGLGWLLGLGNRERTRDRLGDVAGALCLLIGLCALALGARVLTRALDEPNRFSLLLGNAIRKSNTPTSYDALIVQLGHAMVPWSAVIPFALGRMFGQPPRAESRELDRQAALRSVLVLCAVLTLGIQTWLGAYVGTLPYAAPFALAAMVGVCLSDFERGAPGSRLFGMGVAAMAVLLFLDFFNTPEKGLTAYVVNDAHFPESFRKTATDTLLIGTIASSIVFFFAMMERGDAQGRDADYRRWPGELRRIFDGNVFFSLLVAEGALVLGRILLWLSDRALHLSVMLRIGFGRRVLELGWIALPALVLVLPIVTMVFRDVLRLLFSPSFGLKRVADMYPAARPAAEAALSRAPRLENAKVSRAGLAGVAIATFGLVLSLGYYPALAAQISPREVFESYREHARAGEELGLIGRGGSASAMYCAGREVPSFAGASDAFDWLMEKSGRRWLIIRSTDLPQLNSLYRARVAVRHNVPVLDARSSEILLVSNQLRPGERSQNPFDGVILDAPPKPAHPVDADLGGQLQVLGWTVATPDGVEVASVEPGRHYEFTIYYKVLAPVSGMWETFIHIDGPLRYNADHPTLDGKYPLTFLRPADFVADTTEFILEPNFTPGTYGVFFGLYIGDRRLDVRRGRHRDNRIEAGQLDVH